jgi:glycine betaine/proline transport system substrate-binding protein
MASYKSLAAPVVAAVALVAAFVVPGVASNVKEMPAVKGPACGTVNMAVNDWVGFEASAYVVGQVAEERLGCIVNYVYVGEQTSWQGFANGSVDVVIENWGHPELFDLYRKQLHQAVDLGPNGNLGVIGWYVDPWMVKKYPDITNWKNLNKYANLFKTSESGGKGQLLDGDPGFVTNDEALVTNLHLNYKVVYAGSETALIQAFRAGEENHTAVLGYFYSPQWFLSEVPLVKIDLPKYTTGCDAVASKIACDYPIYHLNKIASKQFVDSGSPALDLVKNFKWTNDDQNLVAKYITEDGMDSADAAQKWIDANPKLVNSWLKPSS